ncbi:hypothetical protein PybrP1_000092 [[Pythium] brassicae (nom. inval.)]|nr:hypothetical protein PybrP1_000092 [[Pythium] brassicae (nom. inval.)]
MSRATRVAIGASFACDDALELPLRLLLREAVPGAPVAIEWLPYASAGHLDAWLPALRSNDSDSTGQLEVDLVLLLLRMSDLEAAHPEQQPQQPEGTSSAILEQILSDLTRYCSSTTRLPPLVVLATPSPPAQQQKFLAMECELRKRMENTLTLQTRWEVEQLHWVSSQHLQELFCAHNERSESPYDPKADRLKHAPYTQRMLNALSLALCRQICRVLPASPAKKVIVLDCDNTLWGGAVAEVGARGVALTEPFVALQRFVVAQQRRGLLLCLCSKNAERDVAQVFAERRREMVLRWDEHVALAKINWEDKSRNIAALAQELSLGLDAFIFIDDNPVECSEVASALPMVSVLPVPSGFSAGVLDLEWVFDEPIWRRDATVSTATKEDATRTLMYQQNAQRTALLRSSASHKAFLSSLGVRIVFEDVAQSGSDGASPVAVTATLSHSFARVLQLHQRTNQFNIATSFSRALLAEDLAAYVASAARTAVCAHVTDRFGHYGLVTAILGRVIDATAVANSSADTTDKRSGAELRVDSFLLSCRALNRGVEHAMVRRVAAVAEACGAVRVSFAWEPTDRNEPARLFFSSLPGFSFRPARTSKSGDSEKTQPVTTRAEKLRLSAMSKGRWEIETVQAGAVAFLKTDAIDRDHEVDKAEDAAEVTAEPILQRNQQQHPVLLSDRFRDRKSLNAFIATHTTLPLDNEETAAHDSDAPARNQSTPLDEQEASKFRRKARYQTKLALLTHLNADNPDVIWSANRVEDKNAARGSGADISALALDDSADDALVTRHQQPCRTAACAALIQRQSACAFQRCRTCCYKIQRLVARLAANAHATAKQTAVDALAVQFGVVVAQAATANAGLPSSCPAHRNERRRR